MSASDIAAEMRSCLAGERSATIGRWAAEVEALPVLTADEIAELRRGVSELRSGITFGLRHHVADRLAAILDRVDQAKRGAS